VPKLKGDVVGCFGLGRVGAIAEHAELPRHDFSPVTFAASVFHFVLAGSEPTLDVNLTAFAQEPLAGIRKRSERDHAMPFGTLLLGTAPIRETLGCRQREIRDVLTRVGQSPNLGVSAKISYYDHFVD
jgi:hypothetical protein